MDYEIDGKGYHTFQNFKSEPELLNAVIEWFRQLSENKPTLLSITFKYFDDKTVDTDVFWSYITEEKLAIAEEMLSQKRNMN